VKILYHITNLPPKMVGTEASLQELNVLRDHFGGNLIHLNPNQQSPIYLPRLLFGFHQLKAIRTLEPNIQLHHLYNADPFPFPVVRWLKRPVIYSISSGVGQKRPNLSYFKTLAAVTVSDERSLERLRQWGLTNVNLVRPGLDTSRFTPSPLPLRSEIKLMVGSAPWSRSQFQSKGIDTLLAAAQRMSRLHLVFLWRGVLFEEMEQRVRQMNLQNKVTIINRKVDVNQVLAGVHASVTLVTDPIIIRSYPHSLIESLAAGKPILVSRSIPMAGYLAQHQCGVVVEEVTTETVLNAVETLVESYETLRTSAQQLNAEDFSEQRLITSFQEVYRTIAAKNIVTTGQKDISR